MYDQLKAYFEQYGSFICDEQWEEIETYTKIIKIKRGESINQLGSLHNYAYFVLSGSFVTSLISNEGDSRAVWFNFDDQFRILVCPDSYFLNESTKYEIKALQNAEVIRFPKEKVDCWSKKYHSFTQVYFQDVATSFSIMNDMRAYKLTHSPLEFIGYIEKNFPIYLKRLSSKNMAQFLGVTPEWYSKLKRKKGWSVSSNDE